ncbi:MAG: restriction endonuclease subunit S [Capnocytophaga granulosa]
MKLADIVDVFIAGDWGNESLSNDTPNAVFCIRGADIMSIRDHKYTDIPKRYISKRAKETKLLKVGDLVIEKSGGSPIQSTGRITYISEDLIQAKKELVCSNFSIGIRVKSRWNPLYVYYYWQYIYNLGVFFNFESKTSGIKNLQLDSALEAIAIEEISLEVQNQIVATLSSYDHKIALNRAINHNLVAMAKQLYDYWFVQFDFPNQDGKPYKSSGGKMVWNEKLKREIPEGWNAKRIDEITIVYNGATPSTTEEDNYRGDIIWITPKDLSSQQQKFIYQGERNISQKGYDSCSTHILPINSILMSSRAPIGLLAITKTELCTNQGFKNFVPKEDYFSTYLYYYLLSHIKQIEQLGTGTTFKEVSREDISAFLILFPLEETLRQWEKIIYSIDNKQLSIQKQMETLTKQRDELLPLLMNGQVTVG